LLADREGLNSKRPELPGLLIGTDSICASQDALYSRGWTTFGELPQNEMLDAAERGGSQTAEVLLPLVYKELPRLSCFAFQEGFAVP